MTMKESNEMQDVEALTREFTRRNLDLQQVWVPQPGNPAREVRQLRALLTWVEAYERLGSRAAMEARGYCFPPIEPDCDPESDWLRFETWMKGEPVRETLRNRLNLAYPLEPADRMSDDAVAVVLPKLVAALEECQVVVCLSESMPPRLVYEELMDVIDEEFGLLAPATTCVLNGCTGYCPGCRQRPWCENGRLRWTEDEEARAMVVPDSVKPFVTPDQLSFDLLEEAPLLH